MVRRIEALKSKRLMKFLVASFSDFALDMDRNNMSFDVLMMEMTDGVKKFVS